MMAVPKWQVTGKCGSVMVRLIPAPRGAGIVAARVPKKVLQMAGIEDVYTASRGSTKTLGNFVKVGFLRAFPAVLHQPSKRLARRKGQAKECWQEQGFGEKRTVVSLSTVKDDHPQKSPLNFA